MRRRFSVVVLIDVSESNKHFESVNIFSLMSRFNMRHSAARIVKL